MHGAQRIKSPDGGGSFREEVVPKIGLKEEYKLDSMKEQGYQ